MSRIALSVIAVIGTMSPIRCFAGGPNDCPPIPVQWVVDNTNSVISNDGPLPYVNGQNGVQATIGTCGTNDGLLAMGNSTRSVWLSFTAPLYTNPDTPARLSGSVVKALSVNVRNLLYNYQPALDYSFTTRLGVNLGQLPPFRMINSNSDAMPVTADDAMANAPNVDALVQVHHCPKSTVKVGSCEPQAQETWFVIPDLGDLSQPRWAGTLILTKGSGKNAYDVNAGQFNMPFSFVISRLN